MSELDASDVLSLLSFAALAFELVHVLVASGLCCLGLNSLLLVSGLRVGSNSGMDGLVEGLEALSTESAFPLGELLLEFLGVVLLQVVVVSLDVTTEDVGLVFLGIE